jgi:hypothetical protein
MSDEPSLKSVTLLRNKKSGSAFKKLRLRVALSVEDCAELCGVTVRTVRNFLVSMTDRIYRGMAQSGRPLGSRVGSLFVAA